MKRDELLNNFVFSLNAEAATEKAVAAATEAKPLAEVLNTHKLYSPTKLAPAPRFGRKADWKVSEDFVPPNDGKTIDILDRFFAVNDLLIVNLFELGSYFPMKVLTM